MPPKPVFNSPRRQATAVAVLSGLFLIVATGLAKLQAGDRPAYLNTPTERAYRLTPPESTGTRRTILIDTPANWGVTESIPGRYVFIDPDRPVRSITLTTVRLQEQAGPAEMARHFFEQQLDPSDLATLRPVTEPRVITLADTGLRGAQFIGTSEDGRGRARQHLLACLTPDGGQYWIIYLTDTVEADEDPITELRANARMLQAMYRSARVMEE